MQTFSMAAAKIKSKHKDIDENNIIPVNDKLKLLKSKAIYGANASGKSNFIEVFSVMIKLIMTSVENKNLIDQLVEPFKLSSETENLPSYFQIVFVLENKKYRYGFEIKGKKIISEWLFGTPNKQEVYFFTREEQEVKINEKQFKEGRIFAQIGRNGNTLFRDNSLLLSVSAALNGLIATQVSSYFKTHYTAIFGVTDREIESIAIANMLNENTRQKMVELLNKSDFGIKSLDKTRTTVENLPRYYPENNNVYAKSEKIDAVITEHSKYGINGERIGEEQFFLKQHESEGTIKMFNLSPLIINTLAGGSILIIDELDARLHPLLTQKIVALFNAKETNPNNAQLIFATHDTNLLNAKLMRRDQICFVEKDKYEASHLYSLVEFKGIRNDASYEKDYIKGKYGAIPFLGNVESVFELEPEDA